MVMQPQFSEWPMNSAYVYVQFCAMYGRQRLVVTVCKSERENRKEIKVVCIVSASGAGGYYGYHDVIQILITFSRTLVYWHSS